MKVFAIGSASKPMTDEQRKEIMPKEVPGTLKLYLDGKIEQFWFRDDKPGEVFLMNVESVDQAKATVNALPLAAGGFLTFETIPVGPAQASRPSHPGLVSKPAVEHRAAFPWTAGPRARPRAA